MGGGYGIRLFAGFAGLVLVMLIVPGVVLASLFGGFRDDLDRSELRTAANSLRVQIVYLLSQAEAYSRDQLVTLISEQAEHAGLIVILTDGSGRVIEGFAPEQGLEDDNIGLGYVQIIERATPPTGSTPSCTSVTSGDRCSSGCWSLPTPTGAQTGAC